MTFKNRHPILYRLRGGRFVALVYGVASAVTVSLFALFPGGWW